MSMMSTLEPTVENKVEILKKNVKNIRRQTLNYCTCMYKVTGHPHNLDTNYMYYKSFIYACIFHFFILKKIGYLELNSKCVCIKHHQIIYEYFCLSNWSVVAVTKPIRFKEWNYFLPRLILLCLSLHLDLFYGCCS